MQEEPEELIAHMKSLGYLKSKSLEEALRKYPRHEFVPKNLRELSYRDSPLSIGHGQTISQPSVTVLMTEYLEVKEGNRVLEVGSGSGWSASLLSYLVGEKGFVYTIERIKGLAAFAKKNLEKFNIKNAKVYERDGSLGLKEHAPFDRIIMTCACPDIPKPFIHQLKKDGIMVLPLGNLYMQKMVIIKKIEKGIEKKELPGYFVFVPLLGHYGFKLE